MLGFKAEAVRLVLNEHDPMGLIRLGAPKDEYRPELLTIIPRLEKCSSSDEATTALFEEFQYWFFPLDVGEVADWKKVGSAVWSAYCGA